MGRCRGGSRLADGLEQLRNALFEYYGAVSELKTLSESQPHLASTIEIPDKPEALVLWEKCRALGLQLLSGGLADQPHIWLEEVAVIRDIEFAFSMVNK